MLVYFIKLLTSNRIMAKVTLVSRKGLQRFFFNFLGEKLNGKMEKLDCCKNKIHHIKVQSI